MVGALRNLDIQGIDRFCTKVDRLLDLQAIEEVSTDVTYAE